MNSDEIRLWREPVEGPPEFILEKPEDPVTERSYVAISAAKHAALMRMVEAVKARVEFEDGMDGVGFCGTADRECHRWLVKHENAAYRAFVSVSLSRPGVLDGTVAIVEEKKQ